jgi:hypothetical protein
VIVFELIPDAQGNVTEERFFEVCRVLADGLNGTGIRSLVLDPTQVKLTRVDIEAPASEEPCPNCGIRELDATSRRCAGCGGQR